MNRCSAVFACFCSLLISLGLMAPAQADTGGIRPGAEAGFEQIDPIKYQFIVRSGAEIEVPFTTTTSRMFYTFQPADKSPETAPLFVFLNGGPGAATTANFFANNTAPYTINLNAVGKDPAGVVENPNSWTSIANLLYIDPSQSGFSYNVSDSVFEDSEYGSVLQALWSEYWQNGNFNTFIDADQILRVILAFLAKHPDMAQREVVMVGESYGGVRVSLILNMLMNSGLYDSKGAGFFHDSELASMIRRHFGTGDVAPTPEQVTKQFTSQILVQPQLSSYQDEETGKLYWDNTKTSVIDEIAKKSGHEGDYTRRKFWRCGNFIVYTKATCTVMEYIPSFGRDRYDYAQKKDYSDNQDAYANKALRDKDILTTMLGVDPTRIPFLAAADRTHAYHTMGYPVIGDDERESPPKNSLAALLGRLDAPDSYYVSWNEILYMAATRNIISFSRSNLPLSPDKDPIYGDMFLDNVRHVRTFLTDAKRDLVIFSEAMAPALSRHAAVKSVTATEQNAVEPGVMTVTWKDGTATDIAWPIYPEAGHAVAMTMPDKLLGDVTTWISQTAQPNPRIRWTVGRQRIASWKKEGIKVSAPKPAARSRATLLMSVREADNGGLRARGSLRWQAGDKRVILRDVEVRKDRLTARIRGQRVPVLRVAGVRSGEQAKATLTGPGARALSQLGAGTFSSGQPMGRLAYAS